ncbi:MAG: tetratricopeptide repeat protein, partial [Roseiflexaceae bacterium]
VAFSPDGRYLAAGSIDGEIWLWRVADNQQVELFQGHTGPVNSVAFSPDNRILASGSSDGLIMFWSLANGAHLATLSGHSSRVWSVAFDPNGALLASGSHDQTIKLWSVTTGACLATLAEHSAAVASVAFSPNGALLASGSHDPNPTIKCWDVASRTCVATLAGHTADIWSVAFSPDGSLLASGSADLTIRLWSVDSGTHSATLRGHTARIRSVAWSSDGATLASGSLDQTVKVWDIAALQLRAGQAVINADAVSGVCRATLAENTGPVNGVAFSPDGDTLAGGGELQTIALWSVARKECLALLYGYNSGVLALAFSPDGATLASAGFDRTIRLWSAARRMELARLAGHTGAIYSLAFSPDGTLLVSGSGGNDRSIRLWSVARTTCLVSLVEHRSPVVAVAWSADAYTIASGSLGRTIKLWSPTSATSLATLSGHSDAVRALAFSPDGRLLASASYDRTVRLWAVARREPIQTCIGHTAPVRAVTFSPDGQIVASGSADQTIRLWSVASGVCLAILSEHSGEVVSLAFSLDGALLASGSFDGTVRLWDVSTARQAGASASLATLNPQAGVIYALAFSRDGRTFASGGADGLITLWDLPTRQATATLRGEQPYAGMNITAATGLTEAQRATLRALGAVDRMGAAPARTVERTPTIGSAADGADGAPLPSGDPTVVLGLLFQPTSFIGRSAELAAIARLLADPQCRLLTLLGPGGIGKTRLAQAVAATHNTAFADGVAFVALAAVETPNQIVSTIGAALSLSFVGQPNPTAHLLGYLRERHMLLVLDNFEHLLADIDLVAALVAHAPQVTILVTSRERLNLQTEWLFDVGGLAYPPEDQPESATAQRLADATSYSAVQLFVQRARQVQPELALSESTLTTIVRICQHIAGMPLAIELAAASLRTLPLAEIERQIGANLDILATTRRDVPARHRSMRAMFDHSWQLLSDPERALFSRVAVFRGGWTVDAAQQVARATLPVLTALVDKSLVRLSDRQTQPGAVADARFVMLEPLREYALEQLAARGEAEVLRRAHASYYLALAAEAAAQWYTPTIDAWIAKLHRESDNMRAALQWARDSGNHFVGLQLAGALWKFWQGYGYTSEGRSWLDQLLTLDDPHPDPATMVARLSGLQAAAWLASDQDDDAQATRLLEQSVLLRRALRETTSQTNPLVNAARQARTEGQYQRATAALEDALSRYSELRERIRQGSVDLELEIFDLGQVLRVLGVVRREQGNFAQATALLEESLTMYRRFGEREGVAFSLVGLADVARDHGDAARVREYGAESLSILRELRIQWMLGFALNNLALGAYVEGDLAQAFTLIDESVTLFRDLKAYSSLAEVLITQGHILRAQGHAAAANAALSEALRLAWAVGPHLFVAAALEGLADLWATPEQADLAVRLLAGAAVLREQMGTPVRPVDQARLTNTLTTARSALGVDAFSATWAEAQTLPLEQILSIIPDAAAFDALPDRSGR